MITTDELVKKVRLLVNEPDEDASLDLLSEDTRSIDSTIRGLLGDAVLFVQQHKEQGAVNPKEYAPADGALTDNGDGTGDILLPADFVELLQVQLKGWERPCTQLFPASSAVALAQGNVNTRGGCSRPVCVEGMNAEALPVMRYYSLPAGTVPVVQNFVYEAAFDEAVGLNTRPSNPLVQAVVYECASLLYNVFEKSAAASNFMTLALSWCKKERNG